MIRVAIVEDNKSIRDSLRQIVEMHAECRCVCVCANAEEALVELPKHNPKWC